MTTALPAETFDHLWFTRCGVPTAAGVAYAKGWLDEELAADGITLTALQDGTTEQVGSHHFTHGLVGLVREGGNIPAIWTRAQGTPTRVLGLTWVDEKQAIVARPGSGIGSPADLAGRVAAIAAAPGQGIPVGRPMALHGLVNALRLGGLGLDDITLLDVVTAEDGLGIANWNVQPDRIQASWPGLAQVADGSADFTYIKGPRALGEAERLGLETVVDLDLAPIEARVNNGTPRPITVRQELLDERPELVVRILTRVLGAAEWARTDRDGVLEVLAAETRSRLEDASRTYTGTFHEHLHPTLDAERVALFGRQIDFLVDHGFAPGPVDLDAWIDPAPLEAARARLAELAATR